VGLIRRLGARESTRMTSNWRVTLLEELRVYIVVSTDEGDKRELQDYLQCVWEQQAVISASALYMQHERIF